MPGTVETACKVFHYQLDGLSFSVTVTQTPEGAWQAQITVTEGSADFNAIYWGDDDASGDSAGFTGRDSSLNMNGAEGSTYDGEAVQWDEALKLSSPGLGRLGTDKETFLQAGDSLIVDLDGVTSLDELAFIGIRATSTSTPEGSIKTIAVCEDHGDDDPGDPPGDDSDLPDLPPGTIKVSFRYDSDHNGFVDGEIFIQGYDLGENPTFQDYYDAALKALADDPRGFDPEKAIIEAIAFSEDGSTTTFDLTAKDDSAAEVAVDGTEADSTAAPDTTAELLAGDSDPVKDPPADPPADPKDPPADPKDPPADPKDPPEDPKETDLFPEWGQDISNVVFHFDTTGEGVANYSVKVDGFGDDTLGNDLDAYFSEMRAFIAENNPDIDPETTLLGVSIKGGTQETQYFAVENDENGAEPDPDQAPDPLLNTGPGNDDVLFYEDFVRFFGSFEERESAAAETAEDDEGAEPALAF